jgi:hypothetical protein
VFRTRGEVKAFLGGWGRGAASDAGDGEEEIEIEEIQLVANNAARKVDTSDEADLEDEEATDTLNAEGGAF